MFKNLNSIGDVVGGFLVIALVTTLVAHRETRENIKAVGSAGTQFLRTAMGQKPGGGY